MYLDAIFHPLVMLKQGVGSVFADNIQPAVLAKSIKLLGRGVFCGYNETYILAARLADAVKGAVITQKQLVKFILFAHISQVPFRDIDSYPSE